MTQVSSWCQRTEWDYLKKDHSAGARGEWHLIRVESVRARGQTLIKLGAYGSTHTDTGGEDISTWLPLTETP